LNDSIVLSETIIIRKRNNSFKVPKEKTVNENSVSGGKYTFKNESKIDLPYDPAIILLGIYPKECKTGYSRGTCTPMFIAALFTVAKL
jgi:hypothetical protein